MNSVSSINAAKIKSRPSLSDAFFLRYATKKAIRIPHELDLPWE